jgi:hypothetical protein
MAGGPGDYSGLFSDTNFREIVQDLVNLLKMNGILDISLEVNEDVPGVAYGHVTLSDCKAVILLARDPPPIMFKIGMSDEYIDKCFQDSTRTLTSQERKQIKDDNQKQMPIRRPNLYLLVDFVKGYCRDLRTRMGTRRVPLPSVPLPPLPLDINSYGKTPLPPLDLEASKRQNLNEILQRIESVINEIQAGSIDKDCLKALRSWLALIKQYFLQRK